MYDPAVDPLLQPFSLKQLRLRNRVVSTSHEPAYGEEGMPKDRYRLYHVEKARGGVGMTMIGGSAVVAPDSPAVFGNLMLYKDEIVPWLRRLTDDVHAVGAAVMCQITHLGRRTSNFDGDWLPAVYPSTLREPAHRTIPKAAEEWDITRIVQDYATVAERCKASGLDGIEVESYGHLFDAFLSPATNRRTDRWGGSLANRMRFPLAVLKAIRRAVGPDYIVGVRMSMDEDRADGLKYDEAITALRAYVDAGVDFVSVIHGSIESDATLARVIPGMGTPSAPFLKFAGRVRQDIRIPVMHAGRIQDVATARYALREGLVDLVGMTRPLLADPYLVNKVRTGQEDRIRPCVGANYCLDSIYANGAAKCIHNAATGREGQFHHELAHTDNPIRRAIVVGAGPAGLEAARVLGGRGHHVVVFEANNAPGGQVRLAAANARRRDLIGIIDWRVAEFAHADVELRCGVLADREEVLAEKPDLVIIATGGVPDTTFLTSGAEFVNDTWDVLGGSLHDAGSVLVYDENGGYPAMDAAEVLAKAGSRVEFVTRERTLAPDIGGMNSPAYLKAFAEHGVATTLAWELRRVERGNSGKLRAVLYSEYAGLETVRDVDRVVVEHGNLPNDDLYFALVGDSSNGGQVDQPALLAMQPQTIRSNDGGRFQLFRIGDAVSSRSVHTAIFDALRLCTPI